VAQLGEEMLKLFELHTGVASLAMEGSKAPSKKGSKRGAAAAAAAAGGTAPDAGGEQQVRWLRRSLLPCLCVCSTCPRSITCEVVSKCNAAALLAKLR
jgi:hypothetical protein